MSRMHSGKRGKSGSKKPSVKLPPSWVKYSREEVIAMVEKLAKEGIPLAIIGKKLRDDFGIPSVRIMTGKSVSQVLREKAMLAAFPQDLIDLIRKAMNIREHIKENGGDVQNKKKLNDVESKIKRVVRYYHKAHRLPKDWKYDPEKAVLLVK